MHESTDAQNMSYWIFSCGFTVEVEEIGKHN